MTAYGGAGDFVHLIATAALDADEWKYRSPDLFTPEKQQPYELTGMQGERQIPSGRFGT